MREIGSCEAIIQNIRTLVDGGIRISLDLDPQSMELLTELLKIKMIGETTVFVGFAAHE